MNDELERLREENWRLICERQQRDWEADRNSRLALWIGGVLLLIALICNQWGRW